MTLSFLQLNMNGDNYWDTLVAFLKIHDFDVIQFQEVCGKGTIAGNLNTKIDCFEALKELLKDTHNGEIAITQRYASSPTAYLANATFYKKKFSLIDVNVLTLHNNPKPFPKTETNYESVGRKILHLTLNIHGKYISFINTHFAWAPTPKELPHQTKQGKILLEYLRKVQRPLVLTGDFNMDPDQPTIKEINTLARNLISENNIINTLNPRMHAVAGMNLDIAVDYIFVTPDITVNKFNVLENEDLSDHLGLTAEIEI